MKNMDQIPSATTLLDVLSPHYFVLLLLLVLPLAFFIHKHIASPYSKRRPLPPGPRPWPIIGNIHQLGKKLHISFAHFAKLHGPLISLRLGTQVVVVASSPMAAKEILNTHDRMLSARSVPKALPNKICDIDRVAIVWASTCNDTWKSLRALCRTELFSTSAIESQAAMREQKVTEMVEFLSRKQGQVVNLSEVVFTCAFNMICNLLFSKDLLSFEDEDRNSGLKKVVSRQMELAVVPNIADFYPILAELDPQGMKRKMSDAMKEIFGAWKSHVKERRETHVPGSTTVDFLDVFLANDFDDDQINWLAFELLMAGSETTSTTIEWAMTELLKNKQVLEKACEEVDREIKRNSIKESDIPKLDYLNACVKESMRFHPPVAFLHHRAQETCEVMNYRIPKDAKILINIYAIGRDPSVWDEPLAFNPSRFLGSNVDFKGRNFELIPFGSGRRICVGLPMAARQIHLILANLIHHFDWSLQNDEDFAKLDMTEKFGITLQKQQPLLLVPTIRRK
ncbi:probable (S)-N-methylcoclaurine 3'-hydroxylase isozyme 2 [Mercurialis annua]|uniref:probable (S)-N-methylcoclaurine 3'-hydroxylase isozyme 2 n=1 Tax=Mercurialis annua TaxID=3986 RepID=UPI00215F51D7|nr:probable (S)-N-methylcoclaurine 3'-hydroxylase isozyme 2 [Mercurialis annua]